MEDKFERIERFLTECGELIEGKFVTADTQISRVLASVAASKELTELFTAVTRGFDYPAAKRAYLRFPAEPGSARGAAFLPADRSDVLAFVFCLFVEIDGGTLQLNDFLLRYFFVDGSYTASYAVFSDRVIRPFRDIVRDCFPDLGTAGRIREGRARRDELLGEISERIPVERSRIDALSLPEEDRRASDRLLSAIVAAAGRRDADELGALLTGYRYFLRQTKAESENSAKIFELAEKLG